MPGAGVLSAGPFPVLSPTLVSTAAPQEPDPTTTLPGPVSIPDPAFHTSRLWRARDTAAKPRCSDRTGTSQPRVKALFHAGTKEARGRPSPVSSHSGPPPPPSPAL